MDGSLGTLESPPSDGRDRRRRHRQHHDARGVAPALVVNADLATQKVSASALLPHPTARARAVRGRGATNAGAPATADSRPMTEHQPRRPSVRPPFRSSHPASARGAARVQARVAAAAQARDRRAAHPHPRPRLVARPRRRSLKRLRMRGLHRAPAKPRRGVPPNASGVDGASRALVGSAPSAPDDLRSVRPRAASVNVTRTRWQIAVEARAIARRTRRFPTHRRSAALRRCARTAACTRTRSGASEDGIEEEMWAPTDDPVNVAKIAHKIASSRRWCVARAETARVATRLLGRASRRDEREAECRDGAP